MKSIKKFLASLAVGILLISTGFLAYGQSSVIIGTGTLSYTSALYPIYRSSAASSYDYSMGWGLYTATDLSSIPIGATIVKIAWDKTDANSTVGNAKFDIYLKNSSLTTLPSATWAVATTGATLVYSTTAQSIPGVAGWVEFPITPFIYNGGGLEVLTNWDISAVSGNPTTGSFGWRYSTASGTVRGNNNSTALSGATSLSYTTSNRANIQIWYLPPPPNDAGITAVTGPVAPAVPGPNNIIVTLTNMGSNTLTSAGIRYKLNGVTSALIPWVGSIAPGTSATGIDLGSGNFVTGMNDLVVWSVSPNGTTDPRHSNDTTKTSILACNPLSGTYTIGPSGNFASFTDAANALVSCGIAGPITFNVANGTYTEQVALPTIAGMSATNTVTFQSASGNAANVILQFAPTSTTGVVNFNGADYFTLQNMTIQATGTGSYGRVLTFTGGADYNNIIGCTINSIAPAASSSTNYYAIYASGANVANYNVFAGNTINNGSAGVYFYGSSTGLIQGNEFIGNTINGFTYYGFYLGYNRNMIANQNTLYSSTTAYSSLYGIYVYYTDFANTISNNRIYMYGPSANYSLYLYYCDGALGEEINVFNNFVVVDGSVGTIYGIYSNSGNYQNYYHNSVRLNTGDGTSEYAFYATSPATGTYGNVNVVNNIFTSYGGGYAAYVTANAVTKGYITSMNYNDFYTTGANMGFWGANTATLTDWQTLSAFDANSVSIDPIFTSVTNLTPVKFQLDNKGTPLPGVLTDIFGTLRSATTPDIGAVEFVAPTNPIMVLSTTNYDFGMVEAGKTYSFTLTISNVGPSPLLILNKTVASPFSIVTTPPTGFITVLPGANTTATVRYTPAAAGTHNATLQFTANTTVLNLSVQLSGKAYAPGSLFEDFEGPVFPPEGWTLIQGPCTPTNNIILNTTASNSYSPSNSLRFSSYSTCSGGYQQYAITPRLVTDATNSTFSFWYRKSNTSAETIRVGWSSTGTNTATDFTWSSDITMPANNVWYQYVKTDLPIGTKYVAIHYKPAGSYYYVYIDDVFGPPIYIFPYAIKTTKLDANQTVLGGQSFNYRVAVENKGANADVFQLSTSASKNFVYTIRNKQDNATISSLPLAAGAQDTVILKVTVTAAGTNTGDMSDAFLKFVSQGDATVRDSVGFTTTAFIPFTPPYIQPFTNYAGAPFEFWQEAIGLLGNPTTFTSTTSSGWTNLNWQRDALHPNGRAAYINLWSSGQQEWLMSPLFDLSAKSVYKIEFDILMHAYNAPATVGAFEPGDDTVALIISTDGGNTWSSSNILKLWDATNPIPLAGEHVVINLTPYSGLVKFGIYAKSAISAMNVYDNDIYVDNFALVDPTAIPDCIAGGSPADSATGVEPTMALSWSASANTLGYKVYFGTTNPPPFIGNLGNVTTYAPVMAYNTTYYWKVVPFNAGGDAVGCPVWTFKTLEPLGIPYLQDFTTTGVTPPEAWSESQGEIGNPTTLTGSTSNWGGKQYGNVSGHPNGLAASMNIYGTRYDWLFTPVFDLGGATQIFVEFDAALTNWNSPDPDAFGPDDTLAFVISTDAGLTWNLSNALAIWNAANPLPTAGTLIQLTIPVTSNYVKFGFYGQSRISNQDFDVFIDNFKVLAPGILGYVKYANTANTPLEGVNVQIPALSKSTASDAGGVFGFMPLASGTHNLTASSTADVGGINSTDALLAIRHFVGLNILAGLPALAADVTGAGGINAADALEIQKFYLKMVNSFAAGPWKFNPTSVTVAGDVPVAEILGLATGDINASFVPGAKAAGMVAFFDGEERQIPANRRVEIPVYAAQSMDLGAISLVIDYPASRLQIEEVTTTYPAENLLWSARDGKLTITWFNLNGIAAPQGSELFTIHARAAAGTETIQFSTGPGEMATATGLVIENAAISMPKLVTTASAGSLALQAWPNPSQGVSQFTYAVEEAGNVKLEVFNNLGERVALLTEGQHDAGIYQVRFDGSDLPAGIYITRLDVNGQRTSVRLVITD